MRQSLAIFAILISANGSLSRSNSAQGSDLSVSHTVFPPTAVNASAVIYTITLINSGPEPAQSVIVSDILPQGVFLFSCSSTTGGTCAVSGAEITVSFASLAAGAQAVITIFGVVDCSVATGTALTNLVTVSSASSDSNPDNNSSATIVGTFNPPPLIGCSDNVVVAVPAGTRSVVVNYPPPEFFDKCPGTVVFCSPPSGASFTVGTTPASCSARDSAGAMSTCFFTVTVTAIPQAPRITAASVEGKRLLVRGEGFDLNAVILLNSVEQKTLRDDQNPTTGLIGKKAGKKISPGETVILRVKNGSGLQSPEFPFRRPSN